MFGEMIGYKAPKAPVTRVYNTADSPATWTKPSGLLYIKVRVWAPGGGGAGANGNTAQIGAAGSGGAGAYAEKIIPASSLGSTETVTIPGGGAAGDNTPNDGTAGADASFGAHVIADGGAGGIKDAAATASTTLEYGGDGGLIANCTGDLKIDGSAGGAGLALGTLGVSHVGPGGTPNTMINTGNAAGRAGKFPGGGGGGGSTNSTTKQPGGAGGNGLVIVEEYYY